MKQKKVVLNQLDKIDRRILRELQRDGRLANVELAKRVGLSPTPCLERVKKLEDEGYIRGYHARLDPGRMGAGLLVFVEIRLLRTAMDVFEEFKRAVVVLPQVLECAAYRRLLGETLLTLPHVSGSRSYAVMEEVKETLELEVDG